MVQKSEIGRNESAINRADTVRGESMLVDDLLGRSCCSPFAIFWGRLKFHTTHIQNIFSSLLFGEACFFVFWSWALVYTFRAICKTDSSSSRCSKGSDREWLNQMFAAAAGAMAGIGTLLFFLITFRSNMSYSRWWEGRCLWGKQIMSSMNLTQQAGIWMKHHPLQAERLVRHIVIFAYSCMHTLRDRKLEKGEIDDILPQDEFARINEIQTWRPYYSLEVMRTCIAVGMTDTPLTPATINAARAMEDEVTSLAGCIGGCLRVKHSPVPPSQTAFMRAFTLFFLLLQPLGK